MNAELRHRKPAQPRAPMFAGDGSGDRHLGATRELGHSQPPTSVPGIGVTTAAGLLAELPEMGRRETAAPRMTRSAARCSPNPIIAAFAARLKGGGKPDRVRVIACLRKLLTILNAMLAKDEVWTPQRQTP